MAAPFGCIVVPGIGGSTLSYKGGRGGKTPLWYSPTALLTATPLALGLANDGVSPWPLVGKTCFADGPVDMGTYEPLLTQLANDGLNPVFWSYDWRLSLNVLANKLAIQIAAWPMTNPFFIICHSMGGLVARLAYPLWQLQHSGQTWGTTAYLGVPHGGSYWAAATLAGLYGQGSFLNVLGQMLGLGNATNPQIAQAIGFGKGIAGKLVGSWPSLYALLPSNLGVWAGLDPNAAALSQLATYAQTPGGQQAQWFALAAVIQASLAHPDTEPSPAARFNVVGSAPATLHKFSQNGDPADIRAYPTTSAGDGTVPTERASFAGTPTITFKNTGHVGLVNTLGPLSRLAAWLRTPPTGDLVLDNSAATKANPGGSTIPFVPIPPQTFYVKTGDP